MLLKCVRRPNRDFERYDNEAAAADNADGGGGDGDCVRVVGEKSKDDLCFLE